MSATFDPTLASTSDHVRLALGDTDTSAALLADETIQAKLAAFPYQEALAQLADALVARFAQDPDSYSESGGISLKWGARIEAWRKIAEDARAGKIIDPNAGVSRPGIAVGQTTIQAQTPRTPRTVSTTPTLMEGFRSD